MTLLLFIENINNVLQRFQNIFQVILFFELTNYFIVYYFIFQSFLLEFYLFVKNEIIY